MRQMHKFFTLVAILATVALATPESHAARYFVSVARGSDSNNGLSWSAPKRSIQAAVDAAAGSDEIWVEAGDYVSVRVLLDKPNLALYGGFAGTESQLQQRDWVSHPTRIKSAPSLDWAVFLGETTHLDGFEISDVTADRGVGLMIQQFGPINRSTIANCTFTRCQSNGAGGAVVIAPQSNPTFTNCTFSHNRAGERGGAIYVHLDSDPTFYSCLFLANVAQLTGGAVYARANNKLLFEDCRFEQNQAKGGGAVWLRRPDSDYLLTEARFRRCVFGSNSAHDSSEDGGGGAIAAYSSYRANDYERKVGIYADRCRFINNRSNGIGGVIRAQVATGLTLTNSVFIGNEAPRGAALYIQGFILYDYWDDVPAYQMVRNCTFVYNRSSEGTIWVTGFPKVELANSLIAYNERGVRLRNNLTTEIGNCNIFGNSHYDVNNIAEPSWSPVGTFGNISQEPLLAGDNGWRLRLGSPCINAGNSVYVGPSTSWDIDGQPRAWAGVPDIGADEFIGRIFVRPDGDDGNGGQSWEMAKASLAAAIDAGAGATEVWVAAGVYEENVSIETSTAILGGFQGDEFLATQADPALNPTMIDGGGRGPAVVFTGGADGVFDGFTIRNGNGEEGGGIRCVGASPQLTRLVVRGNQAAHGAGVFFSDSQAILSESTIEDNAATSNGGGVGIGPAGNVTIEDCKILDNQAHSGAGIHYHEASPVIRRNRIEGNLAQARGGAIDAGLDLDVSQPAEIQRNRIKSNVAGIGGGIYLSQGRARIHANVIQDNEAGDGGGLYAINSLPSIAFNAIAGNGADGTGGGALLDLSPGVQLVRNTIIHNRASLAGGLFVQRGAATMSASIVAFNESAGVMVGPDGGLQAESSCFHQPGAINFDGIASPIGSNGNIGADPLFATPGFWHLSSSSPCYESGMPATPYSGHVDVDGQPPVTGARADIGADELRIAYIAPMGVDSNTGLRWGQSRVTPAAGMEALGGAGEVWFRQGQYYGRIDVAPGVSLVGGFAGNETSIEQRDWRERPSVLLPLAATRSIVLLPANAGSRIDGFTLRDSTTATEAGGAIRGVQAVTMIQNCILADNAVRAQGGAIYLSGGTAVMRNLTLAGNSAEEGGAIYLDGGELTLSDSVLTRNTADHGGAMGLLNASCRVVNCTIARNEASDAGAGILGMEGSIAIANSIIAYNLGHGIRWFSVEQPQLRHNCAWENTGGNYNSFSDPTGTDGNVVVDPGFLSLTDFHLRMDSPLVDAGDTSLAVGATDVEGQARVMGAAVDIGADELAVIHVRPSGNDANKGFAWTSAKASVQAAIDAALPWGSVWVAQGIYDENITLRDGIALYGGFEGSETSVGQRDIRAHETILDGGARDTVVMIDEYSGDRTRLDGFTIRNGRYRVGGGITCSSGVEATIINNTIRNNVAINPPGVTFPVWGGGIVVFEASPRIIHNTISFNEAINGYGAGIACIGGANPLIEGNRFMDNGAENPTLAGGAIYCEGSSPRILTNSFSTNSAFGGMGGAIGAFDGSSPEIINNLMLDGFAEAGGAIALGNGGSAMIVNNTICMNAAPYGAAIFVDQATPTIANTILALNQSGIENSGTASNVTLRNSILFNTGSNLFNVNNPGGSGNLIGVDPLLVGDYEIAGASPCIDAGANGWLPADIETDLVGFNRRFDGDNNGTTIVDMGAREYQGAVGSLQVAIAPVMAQLKGGQWRRVGTAEWLGSGVTEANLPAGTHAIEFKPVTGWLQPAQRNVTIQTGQINNQTGTYVLPVGGLRVYLGPAGAVTAGAQWRRVGATTWRNSGAAESMIAPGDYEVEFKPVSGWVTPARRSVTVAVNITRSLSAEYLPEQGGHLQVSIEPAAAAASGARWRRVGTQPWLHSGAIEVNLTPGPCMIEFSAIADWLTPENQSPSVTQGQLAVATGTYADISASVQVTLEPAQARADGAAWRRLGSQNWLPSGQVDENVPPGALAIEFRPISGWVTPEPLIGELKPTMNLTLVGTYEQSPTGLVIHIDPTDAVAGGARWRRVGTASWLESGQTETGIAPGDYQIEFTTVAGFATPGQLDVNVESHQVAHQYVDYLVTSPVTLYQDWLVAAGKDPGQPGTAPLESADGSGVPNLIQFALGGDLNNPANNGVHHGFGMGDGVVGDPMLFTIAVREGTVFAGNPTPTATIHGITYRIEGSHGLDLWSAEVEEVTPAHHGNGAAVAPPGYVLRSFRLVPAPGGEAHGFLRVVVSEEP